MRFGYKFSNLLGTVYRSGDIIFTVDGNTLICPVGNKLSMYDLANNRSRTLPIEARLNYTSVDLSPDGNILIAAQSDGELHVINLGYKSLIYRKKLHGRVGKIKFSPDGKHFLITKNKSVFVYNAPSCTKRVYDPFRLERVYEEVYDLVLDVDWSFDSNLIVFGSRDMSIHVCGFTRYENMRHCQVGGNTDSVVATYFQSDSYDLVTVNKSGQVSIFGCSHGAEELILKRNKLKAVKDEDKEDDLDTNTKDENGDEEAPTKINHAFYKRKLKLYLVNFLKASSCSVSSVSYKKETKVLCAAFTSGDFLLMDLTDTGTLIHSLNISDKAITSTCFNSTGDWIALGVSYGGQLLVWEWQSESHILKQQGHFNSMQVVAYSPDGVHVATGGDDGKLKLWSTQTSFCFVTFSEHTSAITGVTFTQSGKAILSASLDGTVRAFDMIRYRNFKTLTTPSPAQFTCISTDSSGELVAAGGQDVNDIFLWSLQTGSLLEVLGGHTGPVVSVQFSSQLGSTMLISTSWDKTVKVWDAITNSTSKETVTLLSEGTCAAFRNDGEQLAVATMDGQITVFNSSTLVQEANIEGRNDLGAGREAKDKITAESNLKSKFFASICYSPDGKFIIGAGSSKNVCIYSIEDQLLVKKFEITQNRSLDGVDKVFSRKKMAENGINLNTIEYRSGEKRLKVPGAMKGDLSERTYNPQVRVTSLTFSNTGRSWAACTTEGLLIYSLDDDWLFDPLQLEETNTPCAVRRKLQSEQYSTALMMALRLNLTLLTKEVLESIPLKSVSVVVDTISQLYVELLLKILPEMLETSKHVGFYSHWTTTILTKHGQTLKSRGPSLLTELSALQKALTTHYENLSKVCGHNEYMLSYFLSQASLKRKKGSKESTEKQFLEIVQSTSDKELSEDESPAETDSEDNFEEEMS